MILKYLHSGEKSRSEISDDFGISERTVADNLAELQDGFTFLAGSCSINKDMEVNLINDFTGQAKLCVENLKEALKECGASLEDVAYTRILVASQDREDLADVWGVISDEFGEHDVPSTLTGVTVLGYENQLVEIEAVAAVERK